MRFASMKNAARAAAAVMLAALCAGVALATPAWAPPGAPQGVTPFAANGSVSLAWKPTSGATSYTVFRSTTSGATGTAVASAITSTSYTDSSAVNGTAYWYRVVANSGAGSSPSSTEATATPRAATCSGANAIASENCLPGSQGWKTPNATDANHTGIEGFTTATSIAAGDSVGLKVNGTAGASFHVDIYRTGYYAGDQGRLVGRLSGLAIPDQPACSQSFSTGERSCAGWTTAADITTSSRWTSGVYLLKLVRDDNGTANLALLTVRD